MERIHIAGLELYAYHGCNESERRDGQVFLLDITMEADLAKACRSDDLRDTVNYSQVIRCAAAAFTSEAYNLIERAAEVTARAVLERFPVIESVTLRAHKPDAPVETPAADIFVEIKRGRNGL
jgi:dihydroneopterin aldolase